MSQFGSTLFSGSRFLFWCLGPLVLILGVGCLVAGGFAVSAHDVKAAFVFLCLGVCGILFFLALLNIDRFRWAARGLAGIVAAAYVLYFVDVYFIEGQTLKPSESRAESTPWNAIAGFVIIGLPALWYAVFGQWRAGDGLMIEFDEDEETEEEKFLD